MLSKNHYSHPISVILTNIMRIALFFLGIITTLNHSFDKLVTAVFTFLCTFIPHIVYRFCYKRNIDIPPYSDAVFLLFISSTLIFGDIFEFYLKYIWWDKIIHFAFGVISIILGNYIVKNFNKNLKGVFISNPMVIVLFSFSFTMVVELSWEVFEFLCDAILGTNMTQYGLSDTMTDILANIGGSLLASIIYYKRAKHLK